MHLHNHPTESVQCGQLATRPVDMKPNLLLQGSHVLDSFDTLFTVFQTLLIGVSVGFYFPVRSVSTSSTLPTHSVKRRPGRTALTLILGP